MQKRLPGLLLLPSGDPFISPHVLFSSYFPDSEILPRLIIKTSEENSHRYSPPYFQKWHSEVLSLSLPYMEWMRHFLLLHSFRGFRFFSFPFLIPEILTRLIICQPAELDISLVKLNLQFPFSNLYLQLPFLGSSNLHDEIFIFLLSISSLYPYTYLLPCC